MSKYTQDQIAEFARKQGCTVEQFTTRWIIQTTVGAYFVYGPNGYLPAVRSSNLPVVARDHLSLAKGIPNGVNYSYTKEDDKGNKTETMKKTDVVLFEHSTAATKLEGSMAIPYSYFDGKTLIFNERICPERNLKPEFDENIHKWLLLLGGTKSNKLLDWVATATRLDYKTCALYLHGAKDTGKTIFAAGLARIWARGPTDLSSAFSDFNSAIGDCPLIFADESVPKEMTSGDLRRIIGSDSHSLRRKGIAETRISGCLRLIIAANNPDLLKFSDEDFRKEDVDAIASRILYIDCDPRAKDFLESLGGQEGGTAGWIDDDKIAKHALWLAADRKVVPGKNKFIVAGEIETFHRKLATNGTLRGLVVQWICKALQKQGSWTAIPTSDKDKNEHIGIRFGHGKLYVNSAFVHDTWEMLVDNKKPTIRKIGDQLAPLSAEKPVKITVTIPAPGRASRRLNFYDVDPSHVYLLSETLQLGEEAEFRKLIENPKWNWNTAIGEEDGPPVDEAATPSPAAAPTPPAPPTLAIVSSIPELPALPPDPPCLPPAPPSVLAGIPALPSVK